MISQADIRRKRGSGSSGGSMSAHTLAAPVMSATCPFKLVSSIAPPSALTHSLLMDLPLSLAPWS